MHRGRSKSLQLNGATPRASKLWLLAIEGAIESSRYLNVFLRCSLYIVTVASDINFVIFIVMLLL